jgi:light-regulated signal transduction histidine kinase (bacteriophytochrome)
MLILNRLVLGKEMGKQVVHNGEFVENKETARLAAELLIANAELVFQNGEKEKRASELAIANAELILQNEEKEKRTAELLDANKQLLVFTFLSNHDLQEPLRRIITFSGIIKERESQNLTARGKHYLDRVMSAAERMRLLIKDLLAYSELSDSKKVFEETSLNNITDRARAELETVIEEKHALLDIAEMGQAQVIPKQFQQLMYNLLSNALKFSLPDVPPRITISSRVVMADDMKLAGLVNGKMYCHITVADEGIGFPAEYCERIFEVFETLHPDERYPGTGMGLALARKVVENHDGLISASGREGGGTSIDVYMPVTGHLPIAGAA